MKPKKPKIISRRWSVRNVTVTPPSWAWQVYNIQTNEHGSMHPDELSALKKANALNESESSKPRRKER